MAIKLCMFKLYVEWKIVGLLMDFLLLTTYKIEFFEFDDLFENKNQNAMK